MCVLVNVHMCKSMYECVKEVCVCVCVYVRAHVEGVAHGYIYVHALVEDLGLC